MTDHRRATVLTGGGAGALDKIDGAGLAAGDVIQVVNSTGVYHYVNIQDSAAENSPYVIRPDTNPGTNSWHLVTPQGPMSHVSADIATGQSIPSAESTTVVFSTEDTDTLGEYDHTTGIFTAIYAGRYLINSAICFELSEVWTAGNFVIIKILINNTLEAQTFIRMDTGDTRPNISISYSITLTAGQDIRIAAYQTNASARTLENIDNYNFLTIDRIM